MKMLDDVCGGNMAFIYILIPLRDALMLRDDELHYFFQEMHV